MDEKNAQEQVRIVLVEDSSQYDNLNRRMNYLCAGVLCLGFAVILFMVGDKIES